MMIGNGSDQATLKYTLEFNPPLDMVVAERILMEVKQILNQMSVVFLLGSGSCLGAVRDHAFIQWDDDIDTASVFGLNGLTEEKIDSVITVFKGNGYYCEKNYSILDRPPYAISHSIMKDYVRLDWTCVLVVDGVVRSYPGVQVPAKWFEQPKEIDFLGQQFLVPNPPEEYLRLKYGPAWEVPRKAGEYEKDVVKNIPSTKLGGNLCRLKVLNQAGDPVHEAEVVLVGGGSSKADEDGYAKIVLPVAKGINYYALIIRYPGHEQVLYEEQMEPGNVYVYRTGSYSEKAESAVGRYGTLGNVLTSE
jgi:hypothetical protein